MAELFVSLTILGRFQLADENGVFSTRDFPATAFGDGKWTIQDLVETFIPHGPGIIKSVMGVEWKNDAGSGLQAVIESQYYFNHNEQLPGLHWRHVTFETEHQSESVYIQSEKITVINSLDFGRPKNMLQLAGHKIGSTLDAHNGVASANASALQAKAKNGILNGHVANGIDV
ncbi:hypothetical protein GP486_006679 [Trichoglossum hirsutum]|uniref:Uncharacterized protein n=1 Tax=Trichoglossum hirsutum TaxID=265104 RepID=A0A9P8L5E6_9PEZI|nr:hypothetical protein GP486_006679 [Trichoglossum hirsutum]